MRYSGEFEVTKIIGFSMAVLVTCLAIGASVGSDAAPKSRHFEISYPDLSRLQTKPCSSEDPDPCAAEAAALGAALAALETARQVAEELFQEWSDCVDANGGATPNPSPTNPHTVGLTSVLEAVK